MVRRRARCIEVDGLKKGTWTEEEDAKLAAYVKKHGHDNWRVLPKLAGLNRCGKSCRLRWINYLSLHVKHGEFTKDEEEIIIKLHALLGNKWSKISSCLPGRTDSEIKNMWHSRLKKRAVQAAVKSSSTSPPTTRKIEIRSLTDAVCGTSGAAPINVVGSAAGPKEELLMPPKSCRSYTVAQSQQTLSSDHQLNRSEIESCVTSPQLFHDQPKWWPPQQQEQYNLYDHAVDQNDGHCQMIEMYSLSVVPEQRYMEDNDYCLLPPVAPDQILPDSVSARAVGDCSNVINVLGHWCGQEQLLTSRCCSAWDEEKDRWLEYLERELEL